jgi:integrase
MSEINLYLKDPKSIKDTSINLVFIYNGQRLKYSIGKKINPTFWDLKKQRAKSTPKFPFSTEFNQELNDWINQLNTVFRRFIEVDKRYPSLLELKEELDIFKGIKLPKPIATVIEEKPTMYDFFDLYIYERKNLLAAKGKIYQVLLTHLKAYQSYKKKVKLDFDDISLDFFYDFQKYQYEIKNNSPNYVGKLFSTLKTVLREAEERNYHQNRVIYSKKFTISTNETDTIYLNENELKVLIDFDLAHDKRLAKVRDLFIIGCYTGLRFSDFTKIKPEHITTINGKEIIIKVAEKTHYKVYIPLHPYVKNILVEYGGKIPKPLTNQKMNDYLKELGELVGFLEPINISDYKGGKRKEITVTKYELISTHTARRSFATNAYKSGMPVKSCMAITGHKTEKQFFEYIKITGEENALLMAEHSFFN